MVVTFCFVLWFGFPQVGIVNKTPIIMGHHYDRDAIGSRYIGIDGYEKLVILFITIIPKWCKKLVS